MFRYILHRKNNRSGNENISASKRSTASINIEREDKSVRKQVPLISQEENIRRALRDYYAKK